MQDQLRQGHAALWKPLLWEGSSFVVASAVAWWHWRRAPRFDALLTRPWRWFASNLVWLPLVAPAFVAVVFALRHAVYALLGQYYAHEPWAVVFRYESLKFAMFYLSSPPSPSASVRTRRSATRACARNANAA